MHHALAKAAFMGGIAAFLLSSCSTTPGAGEASPGASSPAEGAASCSVKSVTPAVVAAIGPDQSLRRLGGVDCEGGWAVVAPTIGPVDASTDGEIDITLVLKAENGTWVSQDRSTVCGTLPTSDGSPAYPTDAQVPASLWRGGCQTN
jgi:hypothetical protein